MTKQFPTFMVPARLGVLVGLLVLAGCASVDHASGLLKTQFDHKESGIKDLESAAKKDPTDASYQVDYLLKRDEYVHELIADGENRRALGEIEKARELFEQVLRIDRSNARATANLVGLKQDARMAQLLDDGESLLDQEKYESALGRAAQVLDQFPKNLRAVALRDAAMDRQAQEEVRRTREREARYLMDAPTTLQFSEAPLKTVFDFLSKSMGLNILFDRDVKQDAKVTIFVKDVSVGDAIDLIMMQNQLRRRVVNGNTLIIYPASAAKSDEYEDLNIRTFQVTNADIKYLSGMIKSMLKLRDMAADERTGIIVIRDTPENLRMVEKLIAAHDVPDPEIMLEVKVLEVTSQRDSNIGVLPPNAITVSTPQGTAVTGTGSATSLTLGQLRSLSRDDLLVSQISTTLNFKLEDTDAKLLASPRIRSRNKEIAKIMIGDRVPTVTNTVTPVATGTPVVTGNVTYQDVGLKLEFEPQVYANSEIGIKIALEVSNIAKVFTDSNGGRSYQIGTRNATSNLRLKDGETQILGGLITDDDRNTADTIPGLGHLPIIGHLFGNNAGSKSRSEIVLTITPRIVRNLPQRTPDVKNIFSGTLNTPREKALLSDTVGVVRTATPVSAASTGTTAFNPVIYNTAPAKTVTPGIQIQNAPAFKLSPAAGGNNTGSNFGISPAPGTALPPAPPMLQR